MYHVYVSVAFSLAALVLWLRFPSDSQCFVFMSLYRAEFCSSCACADALLCRLFNCCVVMLRLVLQLLCVRCRAPWLRISRVLNCAAAARTQVGSG